MPDLKTVLVQHLADWRSGWSIGSFGAIAEFQHDEGEEYLLAEPLARATARGGIRIERLEGVVPVAWEALSRMAHRWQQGVTLCLPATDARDARGPARPVLTELGPDERAIRAEDRGAVLFDMGLAQENIDFCIRTADPDLLAILREWAGRKLSEPGNPMGAVLRHHPHRIAISAIGRCEVYQKIGGPDTDGVSPPGPHTHVLPKLLASGRTHSANTPIPDGLMPVANLHPASAVADPFGQDRDFDPRLFAAFKELLEAWGPREYVEVKRRVWSALDAGEPPPDTTIGAKIGGGRFARAAVRNALRQRARSHDPDPVLAVWRDAFDGGADQEIDNPEEADPAAVGH